MKHRKPDAPYCWHDGQLWAIAGCWKRKHGKPGVVNLIPLYRGETTHYTGFMQETIRMRKPWDRYEGKKRLFKVEEADIEYLDEAGCEWIKEDLDIETKVYDRYDRRIPGGMCIK